jgi:Acyl-CoA dehydrogenase N terminal
MMANLIVDTRERKFVLHEMMKVEELFNAERYAE